MVNGHQVLKDVKKPRNSDMAYCLILNEFISSTTSTAQFMEIFNQAGIRIIFTHDLFDDIMPLIKADATATLSEPSINYIALMDTSEDLEKENKILHDKIAILEAKILYLEAKLLIHNQPDTLVISEDKLTTYQIIKDGRKCYYLIDDKLYKVKRDKTKGELFGNYVDGIIVPLA